MSGKTVLITGATSGLGLATALLLAEQGAEVVMVGRDPTRSNFMRAEIAKYAAGNAPVLFLADLSSQAEIHRLAEKLHRSFSRIDVLINNAAAMFADREVTPDGLEKTLAVNHLAPFILTHLLLDLLRAAPAARILTRPRSFTAGHSIFPISKGSGDITGWAPTSARSSATFSFPTSSLDASQERRLPQTALAPDPRLRAWAITCGVYPRCCLGL
jgi:NAD(P)-dependent dehydrogenase (short-subunit alcohol dehydrogenase family)